MKRLHIAISTNRLEDIIKDYNKRLGVELTLPWKNGYSRREHPISDAGLPSACESTLQGKTHAPSVDLPEVQHLSTHLPNQLRAKYF
jgi:hypothetical protein